MAHAFSGDVEPCAAVGRLAGEGEHLWWRIRKSMALPFKDCTGSGLQARGAAGLPSELLTVVARRTGRNLPWRPPAAEGILAPPPWIRCGYIVAARWIRWSIVMTRLPHRLRTLATSPD
ncbi:hypothetical protein SEVIR_7G184501v4 [Setaria viridis]